MRDYIAPDAEAWMRSFFEWLRSRPRDEGNPELATVRQEDAAEFCAEPEDWLILTNRAVAEVPVRVIDPDTLVHFQRHRTVRNAVDAAPRRKPVSVGEIMAASGASEAEVRAVLANMMHGPTAQMHGSQWISGDSFVIGSMSFDGSGMPGPPRLYPQEPLVGLYERIRSAEASRGAAGSVAAHRLLRHCTFAKRGDIVALKVIPEWMLVRLNGDDERGRARLLREFRTGRRHTSPRLMRTLDLFRTHIDDYSAGPDTPAYVLAMQHVDGLSLAALPPDLPISSRLRIASELAYAVAELHALQYAHRDVKPANAIATPDGGVVLLDFGIAKAAEDQTMTQTGEHLFTWRYASPEQLADMTTDDPAMDVYALGVSVYEILTGKPAWHWAPEWNHGALKMQGALRSPDLARVCAGVEDLVARMTDPEPGWRPKAAHTAEVLARLRG